MDVNLKMWCIPHDGKPYFITQTLKKVRRYDEGLSLSENLTLMYNTNRVLPNPNLSKFGQVLSDIPGDALLIDEDGDIPDNIEELLPQILEKDTRARLDFIKDLRQFTGTSVVSGADIIFG